MRLESACGVAPIGVRAGTRGGTIRRLRLVIWAGRPYQPREWQVGARRREGCCWSERSHAGPSCFVFLFWSPLFEHHDIINDFTSTSCRAGLSVRSQRLPRTRLPRRAAPARSACYRPPTTGDNIRFPLAPERPPSTSPNSIDIFLVILRRALEQLRVRKTRFESCRGRGTADDDQARVAHGTGSHERASLVLPYFCFPRPQKLAHPTAWLILQLTITPHTTQSLLSTSSL